MTNEAAMKTFIEKFGPEPQATVANFEKRREWVMRKQGWNACLEHLREFDDAETERVRKSLTILHASRHTLVVAEQAAADLTHLLDQLAAERMVNEELRQKLEERQ